MYTDFDFEVDAEVHCISSIAPVNIGQAWGNHSQKPLAQTQWEKTIRNEINNIMVNNGSDYYPYMETPKVAPQIASQSLDEDVRPHLYDPATKKWILVDTGAAVSCWPRQDYEDARLDNSLMLEAVNKARIQTYGTRQKQFKIGRKTYNHQIILADIKTPVLGWDFIKKFKVSLVWFGEDMHMVDKKASISKKLNLGPVQEGTLLSLKKVHIGQDLNSEPNENEKAPGWAAYLQKAPHNVTGSKEAPNIASTAVGMPCDSEPSKTKAPNPKTFQQWSAAQKQKITEEEETAPISKVYQDLLDKFPDLLKYDFKNVEPKHGVIHNIDTGTSRPCQAKMRPLMPGSPKAIQGEKNWKELEELGIVKLVDPTEPNNWTSAIHLTPKPCGNLRCCGDFRALNEKTLLDGYPLPNLRHFVGKMKGSKVFSRVDLVKAYHQIPLSEESQRKATVVTPWGTYKFMRLAMGLRNSAQSFQRLMDTILAGLTNCFVYMDDVLIYTETEEEHLKILEELFKRLTANGLAISPKKCAFGQESLNFVGYHVDETGIKPMPKKLEAIAAYPSPEKAKQLLGFLGAINYYRRTLPKVNGKRPAEVLQPLYEAATRKTTKAFAAIWEEENLEESFKEAKQMLMSACQLEHPDPSLPLALTTDASDYAVGAVLEHFRHGTWRPLGFWSRHLKPDKARWSPFKRELYAIKEAIRHFIAEVDGRNFAVYTDHKAILGAFSSPTSQQYDIIAMNHLDEIAMRTSDIRHLPGKDNPMADWLSRRHDTPPAYQMTQPEPTAAITVALEVVDHKSLASDQNACPQIKAYRDGRYPKGLVLQDVEFSPGTPVLCDVATGKNRPIVPICWRNRIIAMYHNLHHPGVKATLDKAERSYYWQSMGADISKFVSQCHTCNACKPHKRIQPKVDKKVIRDDRFKDLQVDIVGPLPPSEGMRYLLTMFDRHTRWLEAFPLAEATAANCATAMIRGWIPRFGVPRITTTDNGNTFIAEVWKQVHAEIGIEVDYTPPYHPSSLGGVERQHRDLKDGLKTTLMDMGNESGDKWMNRLPWVLLGRRTALQPALDASAAEMVLGTNITIPGDIIGEPGPPLKGKQLQQLLEGLRQKAAQPPTQPSHNRQAPEHYPNLDDITHVYVRKGKKDTLGPLFEGPFPILERLGKSCVKVRVGTTAGGEPRTEIQHWFNCKPANKSEETPEGQRVPRGRKPLNPKATPFVPEKRSEDHTTPIQREPEVEDHHIPTQKEPEATTNSRPKRNRRKPDRYGY